MPARSFRLLAGFALGAVAAHGALPPLKVSPNHRYLIQADGRPFLWLADTAWELFHRLPREEVEVYFQDRAAKGFNVIETVALAEFDFNRPNAYGFLPLEQNDPTRPIEGYFAHVDWIVDRANARGLYLGFLPTWGDKWNKKWGAGPEIFTPENAFTYGEWLGRRYRDKGVVWILGGDRPVESARQAAIIRAMARGLRQGDDGRHLMSFHPQRGSVNWFHADDWLDFEMFQSGHRQYDAPNYENNLTNLLLLPPKPSFEGEPCYEDHFVRGSPNDDWFEVSDVRKAAYWNLMSGGCGHTFGNNNIWQFHDPTRFPPQNRARTLWRPALDQPGAAQMGILKRLWETWPWFKLVPDQTILAGDIGRGGDLIRAARAQDGSFAFVYAPTGRPFHVRVKKLVGSKIGARWFDPRTGKMAPIGEYDLVEDQGFTPPSHGRGEDWLLILAALGREAKMGSNP